MVSSAAESIRMPSTPRSNQNRSTASNSARTSGLPQLKSGCCGANRCRYHSPWVPSGVPSGALTRVHAGPPKIERQLLGGRPPPGPRPGRNQNLARSADPGPAASAAWNHGCWSEQWFGTMSMIVRRPCAWASAISASASARVPKAGSMER